MNNFKPQTRAHAGKLALIPHLILAAVLGFQPGAMAQNTPQATPPAAAPATPAASANAKLELARTAKTSGTAAAVVYPTLAGFARVVRVSEPSIRNWARRYPAMAEAIGSCEAVRQEFAALDLPALVFDTEVEA